MTDVSEWRDTRSSRGRTLYAAVGFSLGAAAVAFFISFLISPFFALLLVPGAAIGAFLSGGVLWSFAVELRADTTDLIGVVTGAATALLTHFLMWLFAFAIDYSIGGFPESTTVSREFTLYVVDYSIFTFQIVWILVLPAGGAMGLYLVRRRRSDLDDSSSTLTD